MDELSLFPLNTVLYPGTPIQLHVFEERYKRMISDCIENHKSFGVVLIRHGKESFGHLAEPYTIGCSAKIIHQTKLDTGRLNIIALGQERFRILNLNKEMAPYLIAGVESFPIKNRSSNKLFPLRRSLSFWLNRYIGKYNELGGNQIEFETLPKDPIKLAFIASAIVQISTQQKQQILSIEQADELLLSVIDIYRREAALIDAFSSEAQVEKIGSFSMN